MNTYHLAIGDNRVLFIYDPIGKYEYSLYDWNKYGLLKEAIPTRAFSSFNNWKESFGREDVVYLPMYHNGLPTVKEIIKYVEDNYPEVLL